MTASLAAQVRLLISDIDPDNQTYGDGEIGTFLDMEGGNVRLAAAQALDTIATNQALVLKVIRTQDLNVDGAKLAAELRARAQALRDQNTAGDFDSTYGGLTIVDYDPVATSYLQFGQELVEPPLNGL